MLSVQCVAIRDLKLASDVEEESRVQWALQVTHGPRRKCTGFIELRSTQEKPATNRQTVQHQQQDRRKSAAENVRNQGAAVWQEEIDVIDTHGHETVEISLLMEATNRQTSRRTRFRHSVTTIEMRSFREEPDKKFSMWRPLRPVSSRHEGDVGAVQLEVSYSDDYCSVSEGYLLALFCGLAPMNWAARRGMPDRPYTGFIEDDDVVVDAQTSAATEALPGATRSSRPTTPARVEKLCPVSPLVGDKHPILFLVDNRDADKADENRDTDSHTTMAASPEHLDQEHDYGDVSNSVVDQSPPLVLPSLVKKSEERSSYAKTVAISRENSVGIMTLTTTTNAFATLQGPPSSTEPMNDEFAPTEEDLPLSAKRMHRPVSIRIPNFSDKFSE